MIQIGTTFKTVGETVYYRLGQLLKQFGTPFTTVGGLRTGVRSDNALHISAVGDTVYHSWGWTEFTLL